MVSLVVKTPSFHCQGKGSIPSMGSKIPQAGWHGQKKKRTKNPRRRERKLFNSLQFASGLGSDRLTHQGAASAPFPPWPGLWDLVLDKLPLNGPLA